MVMIKSKISRITQPKKNQKKRKNITSQKSRVTDGSDLYDITSRVNGTLPGFSGQELAEASDVHQDIRMWLAQNGAVKNSVFFSETFFVRGVGGGGTKRKKVAMPSLPEFSAEVPLNDIGNFNLERNVPNLSRILCVFASRKNVGYQFFQTFFVWLNTGGFPFVIDLEADKKLEVGVLASAIGIATHQLLQVRESLKGAESCWKLLENSEYESGIQKSRITCRIWLWSDYYIEIFQTLSHWTISHSFSTSL